MNCVLMYFMQPNELVNNVVWCVSFLLEIFLCFKFFTYFLNIHPTKRNTFLYIVISFIISALSKLTIGYATIYASCLIDFIIFMCFMFRQSIRNVLTTLLSVFVTMYISMGLTEILLRAIFKTSISNVINIPLYHLLTSVLINTLFYSIIMLYKRKIHLLRKLKLSLNTTLIIHSIIGIAAIFVQTFIFSIYRDKFPIEIIIISTLSLLIYFSASIYSLVRTNKLEQTKKNLEYERIYNKTITLLYDNIRGFKHDFNNIVQAIGGYVELNDMQGLANYYKSLLDDCKQTNNLNILNPETINNPSIYSLLASKYFVASEKGIKMYFNIFSDLSNINFNIYEFTRILGILLDNAIEAAQETSEKIINIEFKSDAKKHLFIIENSCKDNNISITKIFEKGYSTKEKNTGIGLWKVHQILSKNTSLDLFTTVQNNMFKQQLAVYHED